MTGEEKVGLECSRPTFFFCRYFLLIGSEEMEDDEFDQQYTINTPSNPNMRAAMMAKQEAGKVGVLGRDSESEGRLRR